MTAYQPLRAGKYRLRVDDYLRLDQSGSFGDARTELIEGDIWVMSPAFTRHAKVQSRLDHALRTALSSTVPALETYTAPSVTITDETMPEPDIVVAEDHEDGPLPAAKVRLAIEVSDTTLIVDLDRKASLYAAAGIPEYWVADVNGRVIHRMWLPSSGTYSRHEEVAFGQQVAAATIDGLIIATDHL